MRKSGLWMLAFLITLASAVYQRKTGPTYPVKGTSTINESQVKYKLLRSHGGEGDQPVIITAPDTTISGLLIFRRYKMDEPWTRVKMRRQGDSLIAYLPHQPPAGKLEYYIELAKGVSLVNVPANETVVTRFKGHVPAAVLIPHILFMFAGMLLSVRTGIESLRMSANLKPYVLWTTAIIFIGGMILGPIVQKFAFGAYWTGFPFGTDLTDNKTLIAFLAWLAALVAVLRQRKARLMSLIAMLVTMIIFMIPHSMHGSELDYTKMDVKPEILDTTDVR